MDPSKETEEEQEVVAEETDVSQVREATVSRETVGQRAAAG